MLFKLRFLVPYGRGRLKNRMRLHEKVTKYRYGTVQIYLYTF